MLTQQDAMKLEKFARGANFTKGIFPARLLAHKGPRNSVKLLLLTAPQNSRRLGRVYDPEDVILEVTLTAGAVLDALTKAVPVGVRYTVGPRGHEIDRARSLREALAMSYQLGYSRGQQDTETLNRLFAQAPVIFDINAAPATNETAPAIYPEDPDLRLDYLRDRDSEEKANTDK